MKKISGFTLIELVVVIVILGILAVITIPKYIDLSTDASSAATSSVAGSLSSANVINYASRSESSKKGVAVANCTDVANTIQNGLPAGYTITSLAVTAGNTANCTLNGPHTTIATFTATGIN